jgi:hypothetical protein
MLVLYEASVEITKGIAELLGENSVLVPVSSPPSTNWLALDLTGTPLVRGHESIEMFRFSTKQDVLFFKGFRLPSNPT